MLKTSKKNILMKDNMVLDLINFHSGHLFYEFQEQLPGQLFRNEKNSEGNYVMH